MAESPTWYSQKPYLLDALRQGIRSGKYKAGLRLNESRIAREFGISRGPVREALSQLEESGQVKYFKHRGMYVTVISAEEIQSINSVRLILETEACKLARAHMTPECVFALSALIGKMNKWSGDVTDAILLDLRFHKKIWEASGNSYLVNALESLVTTITIHDISQKAGSELWYSRLNHHSDVLNALLSETTDIAEVVATHSRIV